ncbi:MAG: VIT domain-containing protein [Candidatus Flexifilum sp.]
MKRHLFALIVGIILMMIAVMSVSAQVIPCRPGDWCPPPRPWGVSTNPEWLKIDHHRVRVAIDGQIARTEISMEFENDGNGLAEGTFIFPLPMGAAVENLVMYINGVPIEARVLEADEARAYYDEIVRQYRDPALLEYIGQSVVQANVFPIPPGESRRIEITYSQVLSFDNGLFEYSYPMDISNLTTFRNIEDMSIVVEVTGDQPVSTIYSPTHDIAISRSRDDRSFTVGFEARNYRSEGDFTLYWGIDSDVIDVTLLTYRESAAQDGFFMLLVQPPLEMAQEQVVPRDIIIVLDQSGSMTGPKWEQAQQASIDVLDRLNPEDRFNVVLFSTGWRVFSNQLEPASVADEAQDWIRGMFAEGGTDINGALLTALDMVDVASERPTTIIFLTDGLPTEGETDPDDIVENVLSAAPSSVRLFGFGVGDDVDTFLLDQIAGALRGTTSYVRPSERIDEEVASLYNRISAPVLTDVELTIDGTRIDMLYPGEPLPDLFAGTQLALVGRYRDAVEDATIRLSGTVNGERQTFIYDGFSFRERAGGEAFIARLWATRRIGDLLNRIRLHGENDELVDSIVNLSIRYGIITPYTSFLIDENDILSQSGREQAVQALSQTASSLAGARSGAGAVTAADAFGGLSSASAPAPMALPTAASGQSGGAMESAGYTPSPIQTVGSKTFIWRDGVWTDTTYNPDDASAPRVTVEFLSDDYFDLLLELPELADYFAIGQQVIVVIDGTVYQVTAEQAAP